MIEPGFTYSIDNNLFIEALKAEFYNNPDLVVENNSKTLYDRHIGTLDTLNFWKNNIDLFKYLEEVTYPRDPNFVIYDTWMRYYVKDSYSSLHVDVFSNGIINQQYTNVILIDQSDDIVGGSIVIAGSTDNATPETFNLRNKLNNRLLTKFLKNPGDGIVWDANTVHGVTKIENGHRLVFCCIKVPKSVICG